MNYQSSQIIRLSLKSTNTIHDAIKILDKEKEKIVLIIKSNLTLLGTVTDGDIRRALINGYNLKTKIIHAMNDNPITVDHKTSKRNMFKIMKENMIKQIPVMKLKKFNYLYLIEDTLNEDRIDNRVIIMAGGFGKRLMPLTKKVPKPLLKVGNIPILEIIIKQLSSFGFRNIFITTYYHSEMIKKYFGNGSKWNVNIKYVNEKKPLGTAGSLSLLPKNKNSKPSLILNSDILSKINYKELLNFHLEKKFSATVVAKKYDVKIPYGELLTKNERVMGINEKPTFSSLINAGIYVLNENIISELKNKVHLDMPDLLLNSIKKRRKIGCYPIHEEWVDIGKKEDYILANQSSNY